MGNRLDRDRKRFYEKVKDKSKDSLLDMLKEGEIVVTKGGKRIRVPVPQIDLERIRFGSNEGGVGSGPGEEGDAASDDEGEGQSKAGEQPGEHLFEDWTFEEAAKVLSEFLKLPPLKKKSPKESLKTYSDKLNTISPHGTRGRRHWRKSYKRALKRKLASGGLIPVEKSLERRVIPAGKDWRYRSFRQHHKPENNAVIFYMMDISGSMGGEQKEIVRSMNRMISIWLNHEHPGILSRYLVHDATAKEVKEKDFYTLREGGGTIISSVYKKCLDIIKNDYNPDFWNIYIIQSTDGDNWSNNDNQLVYSLMEDEIFPIVNMIAVAQVKSPYGSGTFLPHLKQHFKFGDDEMRMNIDESILATTDIEDNEGIIDSIKDLFGGEYD